VKAKTTAVAPNDAIHLEVFIFLLVFLFKV
jgi:hypothetical protein